MNQPIIVLHVLGRLDRGGAESRVMDLYRNIDRKKVQFYFVKHTEEKCAYDEEIEGLGGKIFVIPRFNVKNYLVYRRAWINLITSHKEIGIIHGHMTSTASIYLPIAKSMGKIITIAHARSAGVDPGLKGYMTKFLRRSLYKKCDFRFTCSEVAGEAVFGKQQDKKKKAFFIPNAIEVDKFSFQPQIRNQVREELNLKDSFVIGHVGRFSFMKNHKFLLEILEECLQLEKERCLPKVMLLLLGKGELEEEIRKRAIEKGISSRILFLGNREDVNHYYQAMDYFLLPSFYEGLPGTAVEAQAAGLSGLLSDQIAKEVMITDLMEQKSIQISAKDWAEKILQEWEKATPEDIEKLTNLRSRYGNWVREAGFDVIGQAKRLEAFYQEPISWREE